MSGDARDFEAAWKLARACYWLGGHVPANERRRQYERGIDAAKRAITVHQPETGLTGSRRTGERSLSYGFVGRAPNLPNNGPTVLRKDWPIRTKRQRLSCPCCAM